MRELTVLFDADCPLCQRARRWLERQPKIVPLRFIAAQSRAARDLMPDTPLDDLLRELTVVGPDGSFWRGGKAWVMCLWALRRHRRWARRLATPTLFPMAKRFVGWVSKHRRSWWLSGVRCS